MVSAPHSRSNGLSSSHCLGSALFLGKTLYSHSASLHQMYKWVPAKIMLSGVTLRWTIIPSRGK